VAFWPGFATGDDTCNVNLQIQMLHNSMAILFLSWKEKEARLLLNNISMW
jgi:hypothetical protein